jgi:hypothetical protein
VHLYETYLSNATNPIVLESVSMGAIFHGYKTLMQLGKEEDKLNDNYIREENYLD